MSFFAVLFALIIEQARPLTRGNSINAGLRAGARWSCRSFDAGKPHHGWGVWAVAVLGPALAVFGVHWLLWSLHGALAFVWSVAVLYVTLGFRQFSHHFTDIRDALDVGDEATARELLAQWQQVDASALPRSEIVRHVIEHTVLSAHRHVFGVLTWFSVLAAFGLGPAGAVFYRMSEFASRYWARQKKAPGEGASPALQQVARSAWLVIDYAPARLTALAFAVVGSFEDAIDSWRNYSHRFTAADPASTLENRNDGIILAATAGAVNVRLGGAVLKAVPLPFGSAGFSPDAVEGDEPLITEGTPGREPELAHLRSIVGLVWRSVVLWMVLLALLTMARLLG